jgi:hypothetical protein
MVLYVIFVLINAGSLRKKQDSAAFVGLKRASLREADHTKETCIITMINSQQTVWEILYVQEEPAVVTQDMLFQEALSMVTEI